MAFHGFPPGSGGGGKMTGYSPARMKRKDLGDVSDDFSEFSLSSPARKIRRLDAELHTIVEEEEPAMPVVFGQPVPQEQLQSGSQPMAAGLAEVGSSVTSHEERSLVLYTPVNAPLLEYPPSSNVSLRVDPDVIASLKSQKFWRDQHGLVKAREEEDREAVARRCLAIVPWMPSQLSEAVVYSVGVAGAPSESAEAMESEDIVGGSMDVEEDAGQLNGEAPAAAAPAMAMTSEGLQHWQLHCMTGTPQINPSTSSPIMWSWG